MTKKTTPQVAEYLDIKDQLDGPIEKVISRLQALAKKHPKAKVSVGTTMEYGETYAQAELRYYRDMLPIEIERDAIAEKAETLQALRNEARAFTANNIPYPRAAEIEELRKELGFFAMAPMRGTIEIYDGEILVSDMMRGSRRKDGTWVLRMMMGASSPEIDAIYEARDAEYLV